MTKLVSKPNFTLATEVEESITDVVKKVVDIQARQPHNAGPVICLHCKHTWEGVCPVGICPNLECPKCGLYKGVFRSITFPDYMLRCKKCTNIHFCISSKGNVICTFCGQLQSLEDIPPLSA